MVIMKKLFLLPLFAVFLISGCVGSDKSRSDRQDSSDSAAPVVVDTAALREAAEKARMDSLIADALRGDSLKEKHILIDKQALILFLRENGQTLKSFPICAGRGIGQKKRKGDHKTPEGVYKIRSIEDARGYLHDFHDGRGKVRGAYGNWFFRLDTPQSPHIGIHGTHDPESTGKRESDGCIRLRNDDLDELRQDVFTGMKVIINPDPV